MDKWIDRITLLASLLIMGYGQASRDLSTFTLGLVLLAVWALADRLQLDDHQHEHAVWFDGIDQL